MLYTSLTSYVAALKRVSEMNARYFIANSHFRDYENKNVGFGHWFPISLTHEPFKLPRPVFLSGEPRNKDQNKKLCVWSIKDLRKAVKNMKTVDPGK